MNPSFRPARGRCVPHEARNSEGALTTSPTGSDDGGVHSFANLRPNSTKGVRPPRAESMLESIDKGVANKAAIKLEQAPFYILKPSSFCTVWDCELPPLKPGSHRPGC